MALSANDDDLIIKSFEGNLNVVRDLLLAGANVNAKRDSDGTTSLLAASCNGHGEIVNLLLQQNNVDVNAQRKNGETALYMASRGGHLEVVRALLRHNKVDVNAERDDGTTALDVARMEGHANILRLLETYVQENSENRPLLGNVMTTRRADPVELSYQYVKRCMTDRKLGSGAFGDVFLAEDSRLPKKFLVKGIKLSETSVGNGPNEDDLKIFQNELLILKRFRHPNILDLYSYNFKSSIGEQFLVYEYAANGSLDGFLKDNDMRARLPAGTRLAIMYQVARAVHFLHTGGAAGYKLLHSDVKSANIFLTQDFTPRLIDCGLAKFVEDEHNASWSATTKQTGLTEGPAIGAIGYMCPEYSSKKAHQIECDCIPAYDVYSLGVVLAELVLGHLNDGKTTSVSQTYVLNGKTPVVDGWKRLKDDADKNVIWNPGALEVVCKTVSGCITPSSEGRSSTDQVLRQLHHAATLNAWESAVLQGGYIHDRMSQLSPVSSGEPNPEPESDDLRKCASCNVCDPVVECKGEARHPLCARCLDIAVMNAPPSTSGDFQLLCLIDQCSSQPFTDVDLYSLIHPYAWTAWWHRNARRLMVENNDGQEQFSTVVNRHAPGWALQNAIAQQSIVCPTKVEVNPTAVDGVRKLWKKKYKGVLLL